ncbi:hypothetical protein P4H27_29910 [Paenibacillus taichungensis]|uniref:hypothetical protein n=1 Tax=Paenibacillus taichungensis TaxID=484184 RepID=UPI002DB68B4A|nr:hypothetical protein [Paenibacillus taichungensis]MEC0111171.1 hypothetical protein [Paenibacillus taichungensis]MEC0200785.1 hypothetical protein [Paenibacillus taichungensis]
MKPYMKVSLAALAIGVGVWVGSVYSNTAIGAGTSQPGTADDPVVTKSYVDQQIQKALGGSTNTGSGSTSGSNSGSTGTGSTGGDTTLPPLVSGSSDAVEIVTVKPGQQLIGASGAEFIVRSGKAVIVSEGTNGVADLTDGVDLTNGQTAPTNHLLSFPRDGRGITVLDGNKYSLTVMVRGGYSLK